MSKSRYNISVKRKGDNNMKNKINILTLFLIAIISLVGFTSCKNNTTSFDENKDIIKYSRDTTSGTRDGFFTAIGYAEAKEDDTKIPGFIKATDNANMITLVSNDNYGIGYISLASSATSGLKVLSYEGVVPSEEAVVNGTYKLSRNFNYVTKVEADCTKVEWTLIKGFLLFMSSKEGQGIIKAKDGILTKDLSTSKSFNELLSLEENSDVKALCETPCDDASKIEIKFGGSTSVEKIAKALTEAYSRYCSTFKPVHNHTGSGAAYKGTQGSEKGTVNGMHVGFLSRELKENEVPAENTSGMICKDGIVVVVNKNNTCIDNITADMLKKIYSTKTIKWSEIVK